MNRFKIGVYFVLVLTFAVLISYSSASAQVEFTNNEVQFNADNPGLFFQDFQMANAPVGGIVSPCLPPIDENSDDVCFSPGDILPGLAINILGIPTTLAVLGEDFNGTNNNPPDLLVPLTSIRDLQIDFTQDVDTVGLTLGCINIIPEQCAQSLSIVVFGPGNIELGSTNVDVTELTNTFLGILSTANIERITVADSSIPDFPGLLNVSFGDVGRTRAVPTLSEWGLIATAGLLGIVGFVVIRRRQVTA